MGCCEQDGTDGRAILNSEAPEHQLLGVTSNSMEAVVYGGDRFFVFVVAITLLRSWSIR